MSNERGPSGKFESRPLAAAPLFDSNRGRAASLVRWEVQRERNKKMLIESAAIKLGINTEDLTYEAALKAVLMAPLFAKAAGGSIAGIKLALMVLDEIPATADAKIVHDQRSINFNVFNLDDRGSAQKYIESLRGAGMDMVADIVEAQVREGEGPWEVTVPVDG